MAAQLLSGATNGFLYVQRGQVCKSTTGPDCWNPQACQATGSDGQVHVGTYYLIDRARVTNGSVGAFEPWGAYCNIDDQAQEQVTPGMVRERFKAIAWPAAELVVQPPNGKTLVNFPTNFYTSLSTVPQSQTVTILQRSVEIEATPSAFVWHWAAVGETKDAADATAYSTPSNGSPITGPGQTPEVAHEYADADVTVHPWVDVVYSGRFRVDGGQWQPIEGTHTVTGTPVELQVVEAKLRLVG